jgi:N-acetylmuramoyl-L-alanine amidase
MIFLKEHRAPARHFFGIFLAVIAGGFPLRGQMNSLLDLDENPPIPLVSTGVVVVPTPPPPARPPLKIVHPSEGMTIPAVKSSFVYGWADPAGKLTVNGREVKIHPGGGWLTMIPYTAGPFTLQAELRSPTTSYVTFRRITVGGGPSPAFPMGILSSLQPDQNMILQGGETVVVQAQGPPGQEAVFQWGGSHKKMSMGEIANGGRSVYRGFFTVPANEPFENVAIKITLHDKKKGTKLAAEAPGRVTRLDRRSPWVVEVSTDPAILRAAPGPGNGEKGGYVLFPPLGTRLLVTGRRGSELRIALSATREAWIGVEDVTGLADTTPVPRATVTSASVEESGRHTLVRVNLGTKVPFEVRPSDDGRTMDVLFFRAVSDTDWIHYRAPGGSVRRVEWFQDDTDTFRLRVHLYPGRWWGYDARFENGGFVLELRRPLANPRDPSSLVGIRVAVDPGHSEDPGAIGPTELIEKDANMAIALCLDKELRKAGADVYLIRKGTESVGLYDRPKRAWDARADILISVHNNALPEGADPFERNGYGVYYFHPHSFALAERTHEAYSAIFGGGQDARGTTPSARLRDDGLHYGNLALSRTPQMPSILTESAYIIFPEEEALLRTERFQCDCANAMVRGLKNFIKDVRKKELLP